MGTRRLFIAIPISSAVVNASRSLTEPAASGSGPTIADILASLDSFGKPLRTVSVENLHLTLKFLGDTSDDLQPELSRVMASVAEREPRFSIAIRGLGTFPNLNQPSVLWAGISPAEPCVRLAKALGQLLKPLGFEPEQRSYHPHLTLARVKQRLPKDQMQNLVNQMEDVEFARCDVSEITLMESQLTSSGAVYNTLKSVSLTGRC
jgi:2'-5' RNA ligase